MQLYIKDQETGELVTRLAELRGTIKQDAVTMAVQAELSRIAAQVPLRDRFAELRANDPLPTPTGLLADKAFFDDLSGDR